MLNVSVERVSASMWHTHGKYAVIPTWGFSTCLFFIQFCSTQRVTEIASHTTSGRKKTHTGKCSRRARFMKTGNIKRRVKICQNKGGNRPSERMSSPISRSSSRAFRDQPGDVCHSWHNRTATFLTSISHTYEGWWSAHRHPCSTQKGPFSKPAPCSDRKEQHLKSAANSKCRWPQVPSRGV